MDMTKIMPERIILNHENIKEIFSLVGAAKINYANQKSIENMMWKLKEKISVKNKKNFKEKMNE